MAVGSWQLAVGNDYGDGNDYGNNYGNDHGDKRTRRCLCLVFACRQLPTANCQLPSFIPLSIETNRRVLSERRDEVASRR